MTVSFIICNASYRNLCPFDISSTLAVTSKSIRWSWITSDMWYPTSTYVTETDLYATEDRCYNFLLQTQQSTARFSRYAPHLARVPQVIDVYYLSWFSSHAVHLLHRTEGSNTFRSSNKLTYIPRCVECGAAILHSNNLADWLDNNKHPALLSFLAGARHTPLVGEFLEIRKNPTTIRPGKRISEERVPNVTSALVDWITHAREANNPTNHVEGERCVIGCLCVGRYTEMSWPGAEMRSMKVNNTSCCVLLRRWVVFFFFVSSTTLGRFPKW